MRNVKLSSKISLKQGRLLWLLGLGCVCTCVFNVESAWATPELVLQLESSWQEDSNPLHSNEAQQPISGTSSLGAEMRAGLVLPLLSERTRLIVGVSDAAYSYHGVDQLSHEQRSWDLALEWAEGDLLNGRFSVSDTQHLFPYSDGSLTQLDMSHLAVQAAEVNLKITNDLSIPLHIEQNRFYYDLPQNQLYNATGTTSQIGVLYTSTTGSRVQLGTRVATQTFGQRTAAEIASLDSGFKDTELFADVDWNYSALTSVRMRMGIINRHYPLLTTSDSKLVSTLLDTRYNYSPQVRFEFQAWDQPIPIVDASVLYVVAKGARLDTVWQYSDKLRLRGFGLLQQDTMINIASLSSQDRVEQLRRTGLSVDYFWMPNLRLFVQARTEKQVRTPILPDITQSSLQVGLEYTFENTAGAAKNNAMERFNPTF